MCVCVLVLQEEIFIGVSYEVKIFEADQFLLHNLISIHDVSLLY